MRARARALSDRKRISGAASYSPIAHLFRVPRFMATCANVVRDSSLIIQRILPHSDNCRVSKAAAGRGRKLGRKIDYSAGMAVGAIYPRAIYPVDAKDTPKLVPPCILDVRSFTAHDFIEYKDVKVAAVKCEHRAEFRPISDRGQRVT